VYDWAWSPSAHPTTSRPGTAGCWSAAAAPTASWRSTAVGHRPRSGCPPWSGWPAPAGRWRIETAFQTSKNATGLDEHQVRRFDSWYRHTTLVMLAHAILTVIAACERARRPPHDRELIPLTVNEIRRLFAKLVANTIHTIGHWLAWSRWRCQHQARAKASHYRRRGHTDHRLVST